MSWDHKCPECGKESVETVLWKCADHREKPKRYGIWGGRPNGILEVPGRCRGSIGWGANASQCTSKPHKDSLGGLYCLKHCPKRKTEKADKRYRDLMAKAEASNRETLVRYENAAVGAWMRNHSPLQFATILLEVRK